MCPLPGIPSGHNPFPLPSPMGKVPEERGRMRANIEMPIQKGRAAASICSSPLVRSDPLEIRCPGAKAPGKELASSSRCQGTFQGTACL